MSKAYGQGAAAHKQGLTLDSNPYRKGGFNYQAWVEGFVRSAA